MLGFYDFVPQQIGKNGLLQQPEMESLADTLARANQWIEEHSVTVMNVETVVLPNIHSRIEEGSTDPLIGAGQRNWVHQFIRIWFRYREG